jgi:hypothetical protein
MTIQDLLVKSSEVGEMATEKILKPYVQFVDNGEISFNGPFFDLKADEKIGIALIAKDSWKYIPGKESLSGGMKNEELERITMLQGNTVRPVVKSLRDKGLIRTEKSVHHPTAKLILSLNTKLSSKK